MRIAKLEGARQFSIEEQPLPTIAPDEALVKVAACGVCTSELDVWAGSAPGSFPMYLGHEVSGTVEGIGADVTTLAPGDRVGVWVTTHGFAEYVAVRAEYCRPAGAVPLDLVLAEPLACAANAVELADVRLGDDVVIVGAGFMGNLVQQLVALRGVRHLVVADVRSDSLERATRLGATRVVQVGSERLADVVSELTGSTGADITFECTGTQGGLDGLADLTRMSGKIALVGYHQGAPRSIPLGYWNWRAVQIVNAHFRDLATIMRGMTIATRLMSADVVSLDSLVTHRFALEQIDEAFRTSLEKPNGFVKAVVTFPEAAGAT